MWLAEDSSDLTKTAIIVILSLPSNEVFTTMTHSTSSDFTHNGIKLVRTCFAYPEQYDAFDTSGTQIGYLRLRHGEFTVEVPAAGGKQVYVALPDGDGIFDDDERKQYLIAAIEAIQKSS